MGIFLKELKANARALLVWALAMAFFMCVGTMKFTGTEAGADAVSEIMAKIPPVIAAVMGFGGADAADITTFAGFYTVLWFYAAIIMAAAAVSFGRSAVTREVADGTAEFLFTQPVSRERVLAEKLSAALAGVIALAAVSWVSSVAAIPTLDLDGMPTGLLARATAALLGLGVVFLSIGAACAALCERVERGAAVGNAVVLLSYLTCVVYDMVSDQDWAGAVRAVSPIRWITPEQIANGGGDMGYITLAVVVTAACASVTFSAFSRRDLTER